MPVTELWIAFGVGKHFRYLPIHDIASQLGGKTCKALPMFHAFSGCDTVSFFAGKGKKTCWETWKSFQEATEAFHRLSSGQETVDKSSLDTLERLVVLMYAKASQATEVNEVRQTLFSRQSRLLENIPPTQAALHQHILRAVYQGGHVWGQCLQKEPKLPDPSCWGWKQCPQSKRWVPVWTTLEQAAKSCHELVKCTCEKGCRLCKCKRNNWRCTALCACGGDC